MVLLVELFLKTRLFEVENEEIISLLQRLAEYTNAAKQETNQKTEKFQIALSNGIRLTKSGNELLSKLKGKPEDLTAYLIRLNTELCESFQAHLDYISKNIEEIEDSLREQ
jgi:hypothetical protein